MNTNIINIIIVFILLCSISSVNATWTQNDNIKTGLTNIGDYVTPTIFEKNNVLYLIAGEFDGVFTGFNWTGSEWQIDNNIVSGLNSVGTQSVPYVFLKNDMWFLISGAADGTFKGYNWNSNNWQANNTIISGLGDIGYSSAPCIFEINNIWYLIGGNGDGIFKGFLWSGSGWQVNNDIIIGLNDVGTFSRPHVFKIDTTVYLISGNNAGNFKGYNWTGSGWQTDNDIKSGLINICAISKVSTFYKYNRLNLIIGGRNSVWGGFNMSESVIPYIPPTPINLQYTASVGYINYTWDVGIGNVTDSFNINHNGIWTNGSLITHLNNNVGINNWSNITVYAYNNTGELSTGYISDNQIAPDEPPAPTPTPATLYNFNVVVCLINGIVPLFNSLLDLIIASAPLLVIIVLFGGITYFVTNYIDKMDVRNKRK